MGQHLENVAQWKTSGMDSKAVNLMTKSHTVCLHLMSVIQNLNVLKSSKSSKTIITIHSTTLSNVSIQFKNITCE